MKKIVFNNSIFRVLFGSFTIILIFSICVLLVIYFQTEKTVTQEIYHYNEELLRQCMNAAEDKFEIVGNTLTSLSFNNSVHEFIRESKSFEGSKNLGKAKTAYEYISSYDNIFKYCGIIDLVVYADQSRAIVSKLAPYTRIEYYNEIIRYMDGTDTTVEKRIKETIGKNTILPSNPIRVFNTQYSALTFNYPIITEYSTSKLGGIVAFVDTKKVMGILKSMNLGDTGLAYISDVNSNILLQAGGSEVNRYTNTAQIHLGRNDYMVLSMYSSNEVRRYEAYIPKSIVLSKIKYIKDTIYILAVIEIIGGIFFAFILSYKNAKPIIDIFTIVYKISPEKKSKQDYNFLKGTISSIVAGNEALKAELDKQTSIVRSDFIRRLIQGSIMDGYKVKELSTHLDYNLDGCQYSVLIVKNTGYGNRIEYSDLMELDNAKFIIQEAFSRYSAIRSYSFIKSENEIVFLMIFNQSQPELCRNELETMVNTIEEELFRQYNLSLIYLCGGFTKKLEDLSDLYGNTKNMLHSGLYNQRGLLQLLERDPVDSMLYYPIETELKLIKNLQSGQKDRIAAIITNIYHKNLKNKQLSETDFALLNKFIYLTALRAGANLKRHNVPENADFLIKAGSYEHPEEIIARTVQLFETICDSFNDEKSRSEQGTRNEILKYMEANLSKSIFSLYDVSLRFNYVESYLYKYFKEKFGITFSAMLEDMRMKKACRLLLTTGLSVEEIAGETGYNSSHAFRRVLKKYTGLLPTEYREYHKTE